MVGKKTAKKKTKICLIPHSSPKYLGGVSLFFKNLVKYIRSKRGNYEITWIYFGNKNRKYTKEGIKYIEVKHSRLGPLSGFFEKLKFISVLRNNNYDIVNTGSGIWTLFYKKPKNQRLIHTFHGTIYNFYKNHLKEYSPLKRFFLSAYLLIPYLGEYVTKKADKIICVSEKVKRDVERLYGKQENIEVIRTGVDTKEFKPANQSQAKQKLKLQTNQLHGLYIGRGGYWTKGLDRAITLSKELYKKNKKYRLIVIGPDGPAAKALLNEPYIIHRKQVPRDQITHYYNASSIFFCLSRIEGGAPTLVVSEAMASGCLVVCSKSSEQEIIKNNINGLIITEFGAQDATSILNTIKNTPFRKKITNKARQDIAKLSIENWGETYLNSISRQYEHNS